MMYAGISAWCGGICTGLWFAMASGGAPAVTQAAIGFSALGCLACTLWFAIDTNNWED